MNRPKAAGWPESGPDRPAQLGVVLAAGAGERMGRPKALLDWGGEALVAWQARALLAGGCDSVLVVTGAEQAAVAAAVGGLDGVSTVHNPGHRGGRSTSVRAAARAARGAGLAILCNVDQPLDRELVALLLGAARANPQAQIVCPETEGRRIHPVLFRAGLFPELAAVRERTQGLRAVVAANSDRLLAVAADPAWAPPHFNYPEEYEAARSARFGAR